MKYKEFIDLIDHGPFKFDRAWISTNATVEAMAEATGKERPITYDCVFNGVVLQMEEWLPDNTMLFCQGNEVAAVLDLKTCQYYINPKHRKTP